MWPYLNVPDNIEHDQELYGNIQFDWDLDFFYPSSFESTKRPRILLGGYWDTKIDPESLSNTLTMMVLVNHQDGMNLIETVTFLYFNKPTNLTFNDDGINGDLTEGDGIYTFQTIFNDYPLAGKHILPVVARDVNGKTSNIFPFINITD